MEREFLNLYAAAFTSGCEVTLTELTAKLGLTGGAMVLEQLDKVRQTVQECDLELIPGLTVGDWNTPRILRSKVRPILDGEALKVKIGTGEGSKLEFKETLLYDIKRAQAVPNTPIKELRSADVLFSSLKTIAAFLNCGGGTLLIGVKDSGILSGIENDYNFVKGGGSDGWQLEFRGIVEGSFKDGKVVNNYVSMTCVAIEGATVAAVEVQGRKKASFIRPRNHGTYSLYMRQGNRSVEVPIEEIEEFLQFRQASGWC